MGTDNLGTRPSSWDQRHQSWVCIPKHWSISDMQMWLVCQPSCLGASYLDCQTRKSRNWVQKETIDADEDLWSEFNGLDGRIARRGRLSG